MASNVTTVVGEDKAPITTLAIGEEHVITTLVGEQAQPHPDYASAAGSSSNEGPEAQAQSRATTVVGESWNPEHISTLLGGEETIFTTLAIGEEGGGHPTTTLLGEGGGGQQTTTLLGEEGGGRPPRFTTTVVGEEGPSTTTIVGEGGPFGNY